MRTPLGITLAAKHPGATIVEMLYAFLVKLPVMFCGSAACTWDLLATVAHVDPLTLFFAELLQWQGILALAALLRCNLAMWTVLCPPTTIRASVALYVSYLGFEKNVSRILAELAGRLWSTMAAQDDLATLACLLTAAELCGHLPFVARNALLNPPTNCAHETSVPSLRPRFVV